MMKGSFPSTLLIFALLINTNSATHARNVFPQMDQIKNKIDTLSTTPSVKLSDLLATAHVERDERGVEHKILSLDPRAYDSYECLEKEFNALYWCHQEILFTQLQETFATSKTDAIKILSDSIQKKYPGNSRQLITFASALDQEEKALHDLTTRILKKISDDKGAKNTANLPRLNALLNNTLKSNNMLQNLTTTINALLMCFIC